MKKMTIDDKLALNLFNTNDEKSHIDVDIESKDAEEIRKLVLACPGGCYKLIDGQFSFSHLGCLECGTCRVLAGGRTVKEWNYPESGFGVSYRQG